VKDSSAGNQIRADFLSHEGAFCSASSRFYWKKRCNEFNLGEQTLSAFRSHGRNYTSDASVLSVLVSVCDWSPAAQRRSGRPAPLSSHPEGPDGLQLPQRRRPDQGASSHSTSHNNNNNNNTHSTATKGLMSWNTTNS